MTDERLAYRLSEVAEKLGVDDETIRRALAAGELPGRRLGRTWLVPLTALRQWLRTHGLQVRNLTLMTTSPHDSPPTALKGALHQPDPSPAASGAYCACVCGCERFDPALDYTTSSDLTCDPCIFGRHRRQRPPNDHVHLDGWCAACVKHGRSIERERGRTK